MTRRFTVAPPPSNLGRPTVTAAVTTKRVAVYDWAADRDTTTTVDRSVARYCLAVLRLMAEPAHPQAHADAIVYLETAVGR